MRMNYGILVQNSRSVEHEKKKKKKERIGGRSRANNVDARVTAARVIARYRCFDRDRLNGKKKNRKGKAIREGNRYQTSFDMSASIM